MVIQSESRPGYNSNYQVQASHLAAPGGYAHGGHAHGGHAHLGGHGQGGHAHLGGHGQGGPASFLKPKGPAFGVLPGFSSSSSDHLSHHQHGPAGNVQSYTNFESSNCSGGAQPHLQGGAGYGSSPYGSSAGYPGHGNRYEASNYGYTNSGRPACVPGQESWNYKNIDD